MPDPVVPDARSARGMIGGQKGPGPGAFSGSGSIGGNGMKLKFVPSFSGRSRIGPLPGSEHRGLCSWHQRPIYHYDSIQSTRSSGFEAQQFLLYDMIRSDQFRYLMFYVSKKNNPFRPVDLVPFLPLTERGMDEPKPVMVRRQPRQIDEDIDKTRLRFCQIDTTGCAKNKRHQTQAHCCPVRHSRGARSLRINHVPRVLLILGFEILVSSTRSELKLVMAG